MPDKPMTVTQYLNALPRERRDALNAVRKVIRANLDPDYREGIQYGMIAYFVPHSVYPPGYHCDPKQPLPYVTIGWQKSHLGLYLFCMYMSRDEQAWFREAWTKSGKKLDMGKSCVRVKRLEDIPLDVVGGLIERTPTKEFIARYEEALGGGGRHTTTKKTTTKEPAAKKKVAKKPAAKKKTAKKKVAKKPVAKKKSATKPVAKKKVTKKPVAKKKTAKKAAAKKKTTRVAAR